MPRDVGEPPLVVLHHGQPRQQRHPGLLGGGQHQLPHHPGRGVPVEGEVAVGVGPGEDGDLVEVGPQVDPEHLADHVVGQRLAPGQQGEAGAEPPQVPGQVAQVGLVVVVDVEDHPTGAVHVGAEVGGVQVAVDPGPRRPLVAPGVLGVHQVGVEQAGRPAVERERVGGHLAELHPEGVRVRRHQIGEGIHQHLDDPCPAGVLVLDGRRCGVLGHRATVGAITSAGRPGDDEAGRWDR